MYGTRAQTAIAYAMNGDFGPVLRAQMVQFGDSKAGDNITNIQNQLGELKDIMVKNIGKVGLLSSVVCRTGSCNLLPF